ncbi:MAG: sensor histidine kinase [Dehalococcoidia bacterium]|nr:sensor histidine kinase [Dehalococcoidia bacterium]
MLSVKSYLLHPLPMAPSKGNLPAMKNMEWAFIFIRFLEVPFGLLMARWHDPASTPLFVAMVGIFGFCNIIACLLNYTIKSPNAQWMLGASMLIADALALWYGILQFTHDPNTAAYAYFVLVIIEGAVRFGLMGSLAMGFVFALGLCSAYIYRSSAYDIGFSIHGYAYWTIFMMLIALTVGLIVRENQRDRQVNERLAKTKASLAERNRIACDLHDTVLKTLHGLSLEAYALQKQPLPSATKEKLRYIESTCRQSSQEIRNIVYELRNNDNEASIFLQMSRILDDWNKETGIATSLTRTGNEDLSLPSIISYHLCCVLSEALTNIQKHASASHVQVLVEVLETELEIRIHDNGCGITFAGEYLHNLPRQGKFGIFGMKERIEHIGGQLAIENKIGAQLMIKIPLSSQGIWR